MHPSVTHGAFSLTSSWSRDMTDRWQQGQAKVRRGSQRQSQTEAETGKIKGNSGEEEKGQLQQWRLGCMCCKVRWPYLDTMRLSGTIAGTADMLGVGQ